VYPSPAGTIGIVTVMPSEDVWTLFATANELWNTVFTSSMEKVSGSPALLVQVSVVGAPEVTLLGTVKVMAETKGKKKKTL